MPDMIKTYCNVKIEFDKNQVDSKIQKTISEKGKGYVCAIESNNITIANKNQDFLKVVNGALVNICDGSVLPIILGLIHKRKLHAYIGDDLFLKYVGMCRYKQFFLGNTREILDGLRENLSKIDQSILTMQFEDLPFRKVEEFDYEGIARMINKEKPEIIWVSLGAPKQEFFMSRILPYLDQGVMFGFGAIFNFNAGVGPVKRAPKFMLQLAMEWLYRAYEEPKKNIPRYIGFIRILPKLVYKEIKKINKQNSVKYFG